MTDPPGAPDGGRWLLTRQTRAAAEDAALLAAFNRRARAAGAVVTVLLLGNATYDLEKAPGTSAVGEGVEVVALREEVDGRGIRPRALARLVTYPELVRLLFEADRLVELG